MKTNNRESFITLVIVTGVICWMGIIVYTYSHPSPRFDKILIAKLK